MLTRIALVICLATSLAISAGAQVHKPSAGLLEALEKVEKDTGKPNALIYYVKAADDPAIQKAINYRQLIDQTLDQGWTEESEPLIGILDSCQNAFNLVRKGVALDHAEFHDLAEYGANAPIMNFLNVQTLAKLICVQGKLRESKSDWEAALGNYLDAIHIGVDHQSRNAALISALLGVSIEMIAYNQISSLVAAQSENAVTLKKAVLKIQKILAEPPSLMDRLIEESRWNISQIEEARKAAEAGADWAKGSPRAMSEFKALSDVFWDYALSADSRVLEASKVILDTPPWKRDISAYEKQFKEAEKDLKRADKDWPASFINWAEVASRSESKQAHAGLVTVRAALELYRLQNDSYPDSLSDLTPEILPELPLDPFSGKPFVYRRTAFGFDLYSLGPDCLDQKGKMKYDIKTGAFSEGDIVLD